MILRYIGAAVIAATLAGATVWHFAEIRKARAEVQALWDAETNREIAAKQIETARRITAQKEKDDEAQEKIDRAVGLAAAADSAADRLQQRVASLAQRGRKACASAGAGEVSAPASDPVDLLAELHRRTDEAAGQLAEYADRLHIARESCAAQYRALTPE